MSRRRTHRPRDGSVVPLSSADNAVRIITAARSQPIRAETLCLLADEAHMPLSCIVVEGGGLPDDVFPVAELVQELSVQLPVASVALVSCRPGHAFEPDDVHRWHELSASLAEVGVELVEWFVQDESVLVAVTPLLGEPSRWPS